MTISQWPTMCEPRPMMQRLPIETTGSVGISWPGRHAGGDARAGPDDRPRPDVDQVLVVDGALGEDQARPSPMSPEAPAPGVVRSDGPELARRVPPGVDQPRRGRGAAGAGSDRAQLTTAS